MARTPHHLLDQTVTIQPQTWSKDAGAVPYMASSAAEPITVRAAVQPVSSQDLMQYMRDTSSVVLVLYLAPTDTNGADWSIAQDDSITVGGLAYKCHPSMDMSTKGILRKLTVERKA